MDVDKETYKEIFIYSIVGISSLIMLGYTVHMFVGGLVSKETEITIMAGVICTAIIAMGLMVQDVVKRRKASNNHK